MMLFAIPAGMPEERCRTCGRIVFRFRTGDGADILVDCDGFAEGQRPTLTLPGRGMAHGRRCCAPTPTEAAV